MKESYLITDVGSTTTKAVLIDERDGEYRLLGRGEHPTTVEVPYEDVTIGVAGSLEELGFRVGSRLPICLLTGDTTLVSLGEQHGMGGRSDMITLVRQRSLKDVEELRRSYFAALSGHLEPYIEELINHCGIVYQVMCEAEPIGYFCVSPKKALLQFHICPSHAKAAEDVFRQLISDNYIERALVLTRDPLAVALSMDMQKSVSVRCYLFDDSEVPMCYHPDFAEAVFRAAGAGDIPTIRATCGGFHDFLQYTLESSINLGEIFVLFSGDVLLGTGVISGANSQAPYVTLGCVLVKRIADETLGPTL